LRSSPECGVNTAQLHDGQFHHRNPQIFHRIIERLALRLATACWPNLPALSTR
jgi:hypothetical protein